MRPVGFSTGALALGDFARGLEILRRNEIKIVELSALRFPEVDPLLAAMSELPLDGFEYVSFHAPSRFPADAETELIERLRTDLPERIPVVFHPDAAAVIGRWAVLGHRLLVENMDKRKPTGRFVQELERIFEQLPDARLCFDIAHARQVDPTMREAFRILKAFEGRLAEVHISEVGTDSRHDRLSLPSIWAFQQVADLVPIEIPIVSEAPVKENELAAEIEKSGRALEAPGRAARSA